MAAVYETGNATDLADLISKLKAFLETDAGYTVDSFITEGTGHRLHVHKSSMYFNFRTFVAESTPAGGTTQTGIFMNGGTGYNGANAWYDQPGVLKHTSNTRYLLPGAVQLSGAIVSYHAWWFQDTGYDVVYFIIENPSGSYQKLFFGRMKTSNFGNHWSSAPEGMFYIGSQAHSISNYSNCLTFLGDNQSGTWSDSFARGAIYGTVNSITAWMSGDFTISQANFATARVQCFDSIMKSGSLWLDSPNSFNSIPVQIPVVLCVTLDETQTLSNTSNPNVPWCAVGELPFLYWTNIFNVSPGGNITIASDTYKCFPMRKKSDTWSSGDPTVGTYRFGYAIKNV